MKRLNAYQFTKQFIEEGVRYVERGEIPARYAYPSKREDFFRRYEGLEVQGGKLYYGTLQVVPEEEVDALLRGLYEKLGDIGRDRLYYYVKQRYVGISRPRVQQFLNNQELHQLMQIPKQRKVNRAIVSSAPMERWGCDLIDMSKYQSPQNGNAAYVLTVVDSFSKYAWAVAIRDKTAATVASALAEVFVASGGAPKIVQSDNGGEFEDEFDLLLARHGVAHVRSRPYKASTNSVIERFNGTLKRMIRSHMMAANTKVYVPDLPRLLEMYNAMLHTTIGYAPVNVHKNAALWPGVAKKIRGQAVKSKGVGHRKLPPVSVGDTVRIALIRKPLEKPETYWSRELYEVMEVIPARAAWDAPTYVLHDGRQFTRDRLLKVDPRALGKLPREAKPPAPKPGKKKPVPPPPEPRVQPPRERAPSSRLKEHYVH
jgi:transposase InsO family protein